MAHPITDQLAAKTSTERHAIKAQAFEAALASAKKDELSVTVGKLTLTVTDKLKVDQKTGLLVFNVRIEDAGADVTPPDLNPVRVYNPPILVDDPAGDIVLTSTNPRTGIVTTRRLREDLPAALLEVVAGLVRP